MLKMVVGSCDFFFKSFLSKNFDGEEGGGAYLTKSFQTSASTRRTRQSDATRFDQNKQIFFKYFVKD